MDSRVIARALAVLTAAFISTVALAAPAEFRVLIDADRNASTGCAVAISGTAGFAGAERLIVAKVEVGEVTSTVTSIAIAQCTAGAFGEPVIVPSAQGAMTYSNSSGQSLLEVGLPWISLDLGTTHSAVRLGFIGMAAGATQAVLGTDPSPIIFPPVSIRRRVVGSGAVLITVDGIGTDWGGIEPIAPGTAADGSSALRIINAYATGSSATFWFRIDSKILGSAPTAVDDSYTGRQGRSLTIPSPGVLTNDTDPNGKPLTAAVVTTPGHGTVSLAPEGGFTYLNDGTPNPSDTFEYRASNGTASSNAARVTIAVTPNGDPRANADEYTVAHRGTISVPAPGVLGNDSDPDGDRLRASLVTAPLHGTLALGQDGAFTYTHDGSNTLTDAFTYRASDGVENDVATARITIGADLPPAGAADAYTVAEGATLTVGAPGLLVNDTDPDTPSSFLTASVATGPVNGTVTINSNGSFTYIHNGGETTSDTFTYRVSDGIASSAPVTVTITVTPVNDAPVAVADAYSTNEDALLSVPVNGVLGNDSDVEGDVLSATLVTNVTNGTLALNANGSFTYTPNANFNGTDSFTYTANDAGGPSNTVTVTITVNSVNDIPSFTAGSDVTVSEASGVYSAPWATSISAGPANEAAQALNFIVSNNNNALFSVQPAIAANGALTFTPAGNAIGSAIVSVQLRDNGGTANGGVDTTAVVTFNINITCAAIAVTSPSTATGTAGVAFSQTFTQTGSVGGATFTTASTLPAGLTLAASGLLSGTPVQTGSFPMTVTVTSGQGCIGTSATYTLVIGCPAINVANPANSTVPAGSAFNETFTQTGGVGTITFTLASGTLPAGLTLATSGALTGTPTQGGTFPITVTATDANGCTGTGTTYTLVVTCPTITVTNPINGNGTANAAFSETFTSAGGVGTMSYTLASGTLPAGLTLAGNGVLSGTPTQTGSFPITVTATDSNGCTGTGTTYTTVIACQAITVNNPANANGTASAAFSETFTQTGAIGAATYTLASGTLPSGLTLASNGVLSGTPLQTGSFPITVTATDSNGCTGTGATYTIVIGCQTIAVTNPGVTTGTANAAFSQTFMQTGSIGTATFTTASTLPAGLTLSSTGVLSGTPTQTGSFPIVVTVTDANGCTGTSATYTLVINCQTISVTNPVNTNGTISAPFSATFTQSGAIGTATFTTASALPTGVSLATSGVLSGTPLQTGSFPIVVTSTDSNGCTGTSATYTLVIACQTITVTNPGNASVAAGSAFSETFTQSGAIGGATFTTASTLPTGLTLSTAGVLSGTPTQGGTFPVVVIVTDGNGCTGTGATYNLIITCPTITVTNPGVNTGTAGVAFSQTFTQSGGQGTITWSEVETLPTGFSLNTSTGVLSGTTNQVGSFPITVKATDANGCSGSTSCVSGFSCSNGTTYTLVIGCQTVTVTNPGVNTGTVDAAFSQTFTATGILGTATWSQTGTLPAGVTLNAASGVLSGTPTAPGSFPITVKATDTNGCFNTSSYTLTIGCQTIAVTNPGVTTGTVDAAFSQTFTQSGAHVSATFTTSSTLPAGVSLAANGVLSGTPTVSGSFPITVVVTDANGCIGTSATYTLTIACQTISVTNPATNTGTVSAAFSQTFTQSGAHVSATFTTASALPSGLSLSSAGVLSGIPTQPGSFPIVVMVTDANGCTGAGSTYTLTISCQTISVTNPATSTGTVAQAFSQTFTQSGAVGTATFTTASALPTGLTLSNAGVLSGTPTQAGSFPIVVTVTDSNGCTGTGATYTLVLACNVISVTSPVNNIGTAGALFSETFTQSGGNGVIVWSTTGLLPTGISINSSTGVLSGTTSQAGIFPITVTATDGNSCTGTSATYSLTINCQAIAVTNPGVTSVQAGAAFAQTFTATGILGTTTWSKTGALPSGITLNTSTGQLAGTTTQVGSYPITVTATDSNGCSGTGATYTLTVTCPTITVTRTGGGSFPNGIFNAAYTGQSASASPAGTYTFAVTAGALPNGLTLAGSGAISGTPTATGTFNFTVTATETSSLCTGSQAFSISIAPSAVDDAYGAGSNIINNTQFVITGGTTTSPATPFVASTTNLLTNDGPVGSAATAGTFATAAGGSVTIAADGTFIYTPPANPAAAAITSDSFTYTVTSNSVTSATATVSLTLANRVWYVKNNGAAGIGQSQSPFNTLAAAEAASTAGDIIYIYNGDGTTLGHTAGIVLKNSQQLIGEGVALVVNTVTLKAAGVKPLITNLTVASDAITLADGNTVKGLTVTGATRDGISSGIAHAGFVGDTLTVQNNANVGVNLISMTGAVAITNSTISTVGIQALTINNGTATVTVDGTNTIDGGTGTAVSVLNRPGSAGAIAIGAALTAGRIQLLSNTSGTISFTGTQTMSTTTLAGVTMTTNAGATINFSGTLNVTTTTGTPFVATGGGTLNVSGTANLTAGAAANALSLNGITVGGTGVTFTSINATGATTGIALTNVTGTVTVTGGTLTNGTTGVALQGASTNLTLNNVTITGPATGITNTIDFGVLTVSATSVSATNQALGLTAGAVNGTFTNVTSTGAAGTALLLSGVTGSFTVSAGALSDSAAANTVFNVVGGSVTIVWNGTISQSLNNAPVVDISGSHAGTITFGGNVTASQGAGMVFNNADGTYNVNATNVFTGGAGININNGSSGNFTFSANTSVTNGLVGANTACLVVNGSDPAGFAFNGNLTKSGSANGRLLDLTNITNAAAAFTFSTGTLSATSTGATSTGILFSNVDNAVNFNGITTLNAGDAGVDITNGSSGAFSFNASTQIGNAASASGIAFDINNASAATSVTYNGTINTTLNRPVSIQNVGSGTISFTGNITSTSNGILLATMGNPTSVTFSGASKSLSVGANTAVSYTGAVGNTVTFSNGGLVISRTTGAGIAATGGGTLIVTRNAGTANTIGSGTSGTALNVNGVAIGTAGLIFESISQNGGANGIVLSNTGLTVGTNGGLTVTGNAGACTSTTATCTGGKILNTTGDGISLTSTRASSLSFMEVAGNLDSGIEGLTVGAITLTDMLVRNNTNALSTEFGIFLTDIREATNAVTRVEVTGSTEDNVRVLQNSGSGTIAFSTCTIKDNSVASGNVGIHCLSALTGNLTCSVTDTFFAGNRTVSLRGDAADSSALSATFNNNTIVAGVSNQGNQGIEASSATNGTVTYAITNNCVGINRSGGTCTGATAPLLNTGINVSSGCATVGQTCSMSGIVTNNRVHNAGAGFSGFGIRVFNSNLSNMAARVQNNTVTNVGFDFGLLAESSGLAVAVGGRGLLRTNVSGNNVTTLNGALDAMRIQARNTNAVCVQAFGTAATSNSSSGAGTGFFRVFARQANTAVFNVEGLAAGAQTAATYETFLEAANPSINPPFISVASPGTFTGVSAGACGTLP